MVPSLVRTVQTPGFSEEHLGSREYFGDDSAQKAPRSPNPPRVAGRQACDPGIGGVWGMELALGLAGPAAAPYAKALRSSERPTTF